MSKSKKALWISLLTLDVGVTLFLFVISIIMLCNIPDAYTIKRIQTEGAKNLIEWFQVNTTAYLLIGVVPLFILLGINAYLLVRYVKKINAKKQLALSDLSDSEKEELRKELLKDLSGDKKEEK